MTTQSRIRTTVAIVVVIGIAATAWHLGRTYDTSPRTPAQINEAPADAKAVIETADASDANDTLQGSPDQTPRNTSDPRSGAAMAAAAPEPIPLPPADAPLATIIDELRRRAEAGDAPAACRLGFELQRCVDAPMRAAVYAQSMTDYASRGAAAAPRPALPAQGQVRMVDDLARRGLAIETDERVCAGIDPNLLPSPLTWLVQAADRGDPTSRAVLFHHSGVLARSALLADPDALRRFNERAPAWIAADLAAGAPYLYGGINPFIQRMRNGIVLDTLARHPTLRHALVTLHERSPPQGMSAGQLAAERAFIERLPQIDAATRAEGERLAATYLQSAATNQRTDITLDPGRNATACGSSSR